MNEILRRSAVLVTALICLSGTGALAEVEAPAADGSAGDVATRSLVLTLDEAVARALSTDEVLGQARQAIAGAEAQIQEARSSRLPHLDLAAQYTWNAKKASFFLPPAFAAGFGGATKVEMGEDYEIAGALTATFNLWTAGRLAAAEGAAREYLSATRFQEAAAKDYVRYSAQSAYYDVLLSRENLTTEQKALTETEEAARVARAGFEQGTVSRFDVMRAEVEVANRRPALVAAQNALDQANLVLKRVCGLPVTTVVVTADSLQAAQAPESEDDLLARMRATSPELQALERLVAASRQTLRLQKAERGPALQLSGNYALQGQWSDDVFPGSDQTATSAAVALGLSMPIFDGFQARSRITSARADLRTAELELERALHERELAVRQARLALENALATLHGAREAVRLAEETHYLAQVRLENGLATPLERLDAEAAMTAARAQLAAALHASNIAHASLELAVGGTDPSLTAPVTLEAE